MDGSHYPANVINNTSTSASYPPASAIAPHQLQHQLPPLQPSHPAMQQQQNGYGSYQHSPRNSGPNTPVAPNMGSYPPPPPGQNAGRGGYQMMPNNPYQQQQQQQGYPATSAMMPQTTTAAVHPQPIAPAPSPGGRVPPVLRPMPAPGQMPQPGMNSPYGQSPLMPQPSMLPPDGEQPTHVVGSQGRRGVLPSAPGRPPAPAAGSGAAKTQIPQKDADGKFPCPHCTKTYLHAKHLKRHLLRHTGDRPYMCFLCHDTFSRSDILKRHFQKCSIRRGNPTGASHLSHPQSHVKKNAQAQAAAQQQQQQQVKTEGAPGHMNGMGNMPPADGMGPFGLIPANDGMQNLANDQNQLSRDSSIQRIDDGNRDRRGMTGSVMGGSTRPGSYEQSYNGDVTNNINPQLANYPMPPAQNGGMPMFGGANSTQQSNMDWAQMFQTGAHQNPYGSSYLPPNVGQTQTVMVKQDLSADPARAGALPGTDSAHSTTLFPDWGLPPSSQHPYQQLSTQILNFLNPHQGGAVHQSNPALNQFFQPDNIKDFLEKYMHFHVHFGILHIPTFRIMEAYVGLLACMCCVGACYSDRVPSADVREMMDYLRPALEASSRVFASLLEDTQAGAGHHDYQYFAQKQDLEELQATVLCHILSIWHGSPMQREKARRTFPLLARLARKSGLLGVPRDTSLYSILHQPDFETVNFNPGNFDWTSWIEQEKRIRVMYAIFLCDAALGLYFNTGPEFDAMELQLPLPSDDAAWEAPTSLACGETLSLYGSRLAEQRNPEGTRLRKQSEMHIVMQKLLNNSYQVVPPSTNLYGKFILIHALLAMLRRVQLDMSTRSAMMNRSNTPVSQNDYNSGRATPVNSNGPLLDAATMRTFMVALEKFKSSWDMDMATQHPPSVNVNPRRYGFSRDAIHFYWLATYLVKNTTAGDLQMAPDQRFVRVIHILKSVRDWVVTDAAQRGEEMGSVGEVDRGFGTGDLTLDMTHLFAPMHKVVESPGGVAVKTEMGTGNGGIM